MVKCIVHTGMLEERRAVVVTNIFINKLNIPEQLNHHTANMSASWRLLVVIVGVIIIVGVGVVIVVVAVVAAIY